VAAADEILIELRALRVLARIGVSDEELELERPLLIDVEAVPRTSEATVTDRIEDTVDYVSFAATAERVATAAPYRTLERLAAAIAAELLAAGGCRRVTVRVAKPEPPMPQRVDHVAVTVRRQVEDSG
jgi:7,8-dihydroneopterin aldolase/epimerase/oxygenase